MVEETKTDEAPQSTDESNPPTIQQSGADQPVETADGIDRPIWDHWKACQFYEVELGEAVALSCNLNPASVADAETCFQEGELDEYEECLDIARRAAGEGFAVRHIQKDGQEVILVHLYEFARWVLEMRDKRLKYWQKLAPEFVGLAVASPPGLWPWGTKYTTPLLGELRAAVEEFWKDCDPEVAPKDGPDWPKVKQFLVEKRKAGTSETAARAIDKIIRHKKWKSVTHKGKKQPPPVTKSKP